METIFTEKHKRRNAGTGLHRAPPGVPAERPSRAQFVIAPVRAADLGVNMSEPDLMRFATVQSNGFTPDGADSTALDLPTLFVMVGGDDIAEIGMNAVNVLHGCEAA